MTATEAGSRRKHMTEAARLTAITGIITAAGRGYRGIRPRTDPTTKPMRLPEAHNANAAIDAGMASAGERWPDCNSWDLVGWDDVDLGGEWNDPIAYASWDTYDVWGEGSDAPDGFSEGS